MIYHTSTLPQSGASHPLCKKVIDYIRDPNAEITCTRSMLYPVETKTHLLPLRLFQISNSQVPFPACPYAKKMVFWFLSMIVGYVVDPQYRRIEVQRGAQVLQATSELVSLPLYRIQPRHTPINAKMNSFHAQPAVDLAGTVRTCNKIR